MLRITPLESADSLTFKLEGKLAGPWVREMESCWKTAVSRTPAARITANLDCVSFIDPAGVDLLTRMHRDGVELVANGTLTGSVLDRIRSAKKSIVAAVVFLLACLAGAAQAQDRPNPGPSAQSRES